jgi:uncharacterized membrane protein YhaH (DUF805 family)
MTFPSYPGQPGSDEPRKGLSPQPPSGQQPAYGQPPAYGQQPAQGQQPWAGQPNSYGPPAPQRTDADPSTPYMWAIAVTPLLSLLTLAFVDISSYLDESLRLAEAGSTAAPSSPGMLLAQLVSWGLYALTVVLAFFDWRALKRRGVDRPFAWPWAFLSVVYVIGRAVVVKRRTGRGVAPMVVYLVLTVVSIAVSVAVVGVALAEFLPQVAELTPAP